MEDIHALVLKAMSHTASMVQRHEAFGRLVKHFQDMAYGCAYAMLGDFQLAEDAAQEAFIAAYQDLDKLKDPKAFPGWFKQIVIHQCYRMTRRKHLPTESLETALDVPSAEPSPLEIVEAREMQTMVHDAIESLPEHERMATTLFYITGYSQKEIAEFLEVPVNTVKKRLQSARKRLKERMLNMVQDTLKEKRPSKDEAFSNTVQLINACKTGNAELVSKLIQENPELVDSDGWSPLHYAAREGHADVVKLLLQAGANPDSYEHMLRNHCGITTLEIARVRGFKEVVALLEAARRSQYNIAAGDSEIRDALKKNDLEKVFALVKRSPELINAADDDGNTPLHRAAEATSPSFELIDFLLEHGANLHATNFLGFKPIHLTLWQNHLWMWKWARWMLTGYLLARGAEYNINIASAAGDIDRVRSLLKADALLANFLDTCKKRPLSCAAEFGHTEIVKLLLDHRADPNAPEASPFLTYPLYAAAQGNHLEMAKMLLEHGANPDAYVDASGNAMSLALDSGFQEMANLIVSYGGSTSSYYYAFKGNLPVASAMLKANPSLANDFIFTFNYSLPEETILAIVNLAFKHGADAKKVRQWTLHRARQWPKVLRALFGHGVDPNVADHEGKTNLHDLSRLGDIKAAEIMLEHGADIHARDEVYKATPLAWAVIHGQKEMVEWFLEKGAKPNLPDDEPWATPLFWAERKGYTEIADILRKHGATT